MREKVSYLDTSWFLTSCYTDYIYSRIVRAYLLHGMRLRFGSCICSCLSLCWSLCSAPHFTLLYTISVVLSVKPISVK